MRSMKVIIAAFVLCGLMSFSSYGADVAKIGIIDLQRVAETSSAGKASKAEIEKQGKNMETELRNKQAELEEAKKRLEREAMVMTREMREEKERDFRIKVNDLRTLEKKYKQEMNELNKRLVRQLQKDVFEIVQEIGKKEGYLLILEQVGVIYSPNSIDVTDKVIQRYNAIFAEKSTKK